VIVLLVDANRFAVRREGSAGEWTIDISTLLHNLAVAGAICAGRTQGILFCDGYQTWAPGCGRQHPALNATEKS